MYQMLELTERTRLMIAGLTAVAGGATAVAITELGGRMQHYLPDSGFHLAAVVGAGLAGFILADGFGRSGLRGGLSAVTTAVLVTLLGAWLGAALIAWSPRPEAGFLGWLALLEAVSANPLILKIWAAAMLVLQGGAARLRAFQDPLSP